MRKIWIWDYVQTRDLRTSIMQKDSEVAEWQATGIRGLQHSVPSNQRYNKI